MKTISVAYTRGNLSHVLDQTAIAGKSFVITKFGKAKAMIVPLVKKEDQNLAIKKRNKTLAKYAGMWKNRTDIGDSVEFAKKLRRRASRME